MLRVVKVRRGVEKVSYSTIQEVDSYGDALISP
jgi:hypothetical protein